jgi:hypothetical protein
MDTYIVNKTSRLDDDVATLCSYGACPKYSVRCLDTAGDDYHRAITTKPKYFPAFWPSSTRRIQV